MLEHEHRTFDYHEFIEFAIKHSDSIKGASRQYGLNDNSWDLNTGWNGAVSLAQNGWAEGRKQAEKLIDEIRDLTPPDEYGEKFDYDIAGGFVDIGRMLGNDPECFGNYHAFTKPERVIKVVVNISAASGIGAKELMSRGIVIAAAIDLLEGMGYRIELIAQSCFRSKYTKRRFTLDVIVKRPDDSFDIEHVIFAVAHPAFLRRLVFAAEEGESQQIRREFGFYYPGDTYGTPTESPKEFHGDLYFDDMRIEHGSKIATPEKAYTWIMEQLEAAGLREVETHA